jgi:hypothetical protein
MAVEALVVLQSRQPEYLEAAGAADHQLVETQHFMVAAVVVEA